MQMRLGSLQQYPLTLQTAVVNVAESLEARERERETKGRKEEEERTSHLLAGMAGSQIAPMLVLDTLSRKIHHLSCCHHCHCFDHEHGKRETNDQV